MPCSYTWDQWERWSIEWADGSKPRESTIRSFWGQHFPIFHSVKTGYCHMSIRPDLAIVSGGPIEFEEVSVIAPSLEELLQMVIDGENRLLLSYI